MLSLYESHPSKQFKVMVVWRVAQGFETRTGPGNPTGKTRNQTEIRFFKPREPCISELWENRTNWGSIEKTGRTIGRFNWSWNREKLKKNAAAKIQIWALTPCKQDWSHDQRTKSSFFFWGGTKCSSWELICNIIKFILNLHDLQFLNFYVIFLNILNITLNWLFI